MTVMEDAARKLLRAIESDEPNERKAKRAVKDAKDWLTTVAILWAQEEVIQQVEAKAEQDKKDANTKTVLVHTFVSFGSVGFPECHETTCPLKGECANHVSAGDFRSEDGLTSDLRKVGDVWKCSQDTKVMRGAVLVDGTLASAERL